MDILSISNILQILSYHCLLSQSLVVYVAHTMFKALCQRI